MPVELSNHRRVMDLWGSCAIGESARSEYLTMVVHRRVTESTLVFGWARAFAGAPGVIELQEPYAKKIGRGVVDYGGGVCETRC